MSKIRILLELIKTSTKAQIVTGTIAVGMAVVGTVGGVYLYNQSKLEENTSTIESNENEYAAKDEIEVQVEEELATKIEDGSVTDEEIEQLQADGKISEEKANEIKQKVSENKTKLVQGSNNPESSNNPTPNPTPEKDNPTPNPTPGKDNPTPNPNPNPNPTPEKDNPTPTPTPINHDEVTSITYAKQTGNLNYTSNGTDINIGNKLSRINVSCTRNDLFETTCQNIAKESVTLNNAQAMWMNKFVGNKYKVKSLKVFSARISAQDVLETDEEYAKRVKGSSVFSYSPTGNVYDKVVQYGDLTDSNIAVIKRVVFEFDTI